MIILIIRRYLVDYNDYNNIYINKMIYYKIRMIINDIKEYKNFDKIFIWYLNN
jgi:hypothetical protein